MNHIKKITQSITGLLQLALAGTLAYAIAKVMEVTGLIAWIDGLYMVENITAFATAMVISRLVYFVVVIIGTVLVSDRLEKEEYFWVKPTDSYSHSKNQSRDHSGLIVMIFIAIVFATIIGEFLIRLITHTDPSFYLG